MLSSGTLAQNIAYNNSLNAMSNASTIAKKAITLPSGTWKLGWAKRGVIIDKVAGNSLGNFPIIDDVKNKIGISIKSLDTAAITYQNIPKLKYQLNKYVNQLNDFQGTTYGGHSYFYGTDFTSKNLHLVIPDVHLS